MMRTLSVLAVEPAITATPTHALMTSLPASATCLGEWDAVGVCIVVASTMYVTLLLTYHASRKQASLRVGRGDGVPAPANLATIETTSKEWLRGRM
jgi:hypothetical protein